MLGHCAALTASPLHGNLQSSRAIRYTPRSDGYFGQREVRVEERSLGGQEREVRIREAIRRGTVRLLVLREGGRCRYQSGIGGTGAAGWSG